jgi:putative DNA methylase
VSRPDVLIEKWLPIEELGIEAKREGSTGLHPPPNRLHVWWARRPLTVSRGAILASLLPQWSEEWPKVLTEKFPDEASYHMWFLRLLGIKGDPVAARKLIEKALETGIRVPNPYGYRRAFSSNPSPEEIETLYELIEYNWGSKDVVVCDPMAGGGSIPLESLRCGFTTFANELNPVASVVLKATLDYPARFGADLVPQLEKYGELWVRLVQKKLRSYYSDIEELTSEGACYFWARTVACLTTGRPVPLSPNWWLRKGRNPIAVKLLCDPEWPECQFRIVKGKKDVKSANPDQGTVSRGVGLSPWTGEAIDGDYIKMEAQAGRMGQQLYAIGIKKPGGFEFRLPSKKDLEKVSLAESVLRDKIPVWEMENLVPREPFPEQSNDPRPIYYGMTTWGDFFSPRQLLAQCFILESLKEIEKRIINEVKDEKLGTALITYLGIAFDKSNDYNSRLVKWDGTRDKICNTFDRHDFSFKWSFAEFDASRNLLPWCVNQVISAYKGIANLVVPTMENLFYKTASKLPVDRLFITRGSATSLDYIKSASVNLICVDPPYYDNVMYAELSDFFYVWMKRSIGHLYPEFFTDELTNKDDETVANVARFASLDNRRKRELAEKDYERKMTASFQEMHRVLHPNGVLTVMFTHKRTEAWNTLARALIEAGFTIQASWPVHTESEHSLHQARKNAAASTILLVCRKRKLDNKQTWWDDIRGKVRNVARNKAAEFQAQGISGVDLYISTFGPVLSILSQNWPVFTSEMDKETGQPLPLQPELALDIAREEVVKLRKQGLLGKAIEFDPVTDWYVIAWDVFKAREFPFDEARKLALALNLDVDQDLRLAKKVTAKKGNYVQLNTPRERYQRNLVDPERVNFDCYLDAAHTAMLIYAEDGGKPCERFLNATGLYTDSTFKTVLQALLNAIPRKKKEGKFLIPEAGVLENIRLALFNDLNVPAEKEEEHMIQQEIWNE